MCDCSGKLIAWLDHELPEEEAAEIRQHVDDCMQCRGDLQRYEKVSCLVRAYCTEAAEAKVQRGVPLRVFALVGAAAAVLLIMVFAPPRVQRALDPAPDTPVAARATEVSPPAPLEAITPPVTDGTRIRRHHPGVPAHDQLIPTHTQLATWPSSERRIEIAIPAEAMFPPGAVPEGVSFIADVSIAADGSAQRLRLRP